MLRFLFFISFLILCIGKSDLYACNHNAAIEKVDYVRPEEFGAVGDGISDDTEAMGCAAKTQSVVVLKHGKVYRISKPLQFYNSIIGNKATILAELPVIKEYWSETQAVYFSDCKDFFIKDLLIKSNFGGLFVNGCTNFKITNYNFENVFSREKGSKYGISLSGKGKTFCEDFLIENVHFNCRVDAINADGLHICGGVRNGIVKSLTGSTGDDFIALNAIEGVADKSIRSIDNIEFYSCVMDNKCPLGLRVYSYDNMPIRNILFNKCKFRVSHTRYVRATPCVRFMTNIVFEQERRTSKRMEIENIRFRKCFFEISSNATPKIIVQETNGDITFEKCTWSSNVASPDIALHNNNIKLKIVNSYVTGGIQGWQWASRNEGRNNVNIERCKIMLKSGMSLLNFEHPYAQNTNNILIVDKVTVTR